ncbi:hypothetical protein AHA02nite_29670 [Alkalibacillus haloalkaliphilus]|uniref:Uncharacterized protein n=1 Tax=Alkalibacillus haloalkaliphilus TaxID=94136 RepID=A0A511W8Y8_9BACI|nr:hypothetical protein AHA02nite_29670 [Alkalibacillus haloalkaliphilus]
MRAKFYIMTIIIHIFLGYLWVLFSSHIINVTNSSNSPFFIGVILILLGTVIFGVIFNRITPFDKLESTNPVNIIRIITFLSVIIVYFLY